MILGRLKSNRFSQLGLFASLFIEGSIGNIRRTFDYCLVAHGSVEQGQACHEHLTIHRIISSMPLNPSVMNTQSKISIVRRLINPDVICNNQLLIQSLRLNSCALQVK